MKLPKLLFSLLLAVALLGAQGTKKESTAPPAAPAKKAASKVAAADQCQAKTKDGDQCKRKASAGSKFCWQHGGKKTTKKT
jgi:hypothetical protein